MNVAVLEGDEVKIVDETHARVPDCPGLLQSLLGIESGDGAAERSNVLVQVAASMRAHGRGGALFVIPVVEPHVGRVGAQPGSLRRRPAVRGARRSRAARTQPRARPTSGRTISKRAVDALAGLTAVDGATLVGDRYELIAFGAKIIRAARQRARRAR